jgi:hypothetical protein
MKKYLLLLLSIGAFAQTNPTAFNKLSIKQNIEDNLANRVVVQDPVTGELKWVLKPSLVPQANATTSGTVKTTTAEVNPQVYTVSIADNLLNAKVDKTTTINGQALSGNITIATGTVNSTDAQLRDRATHTGVQAIATVTGLQTALDGKQATGDFATNTTVTNGLNSKINTSEKGVINGVATLGANGKIPNSQIPALAISETFLVGSQAEMLALSLADQGDIAIRSDVSKAFILRQTPSSTLGNWSELLTPASTVTSVAGKVGAVVLNSGDVGLGNVPNTDFTSAVNLNTAKVGMTTAQSNAIVANTAKVSNATHTGDATGSTALTLATVNSNVGSFGNSTTVPTVTVNGKGLVTAVSATSIPIASTSVTGLLTSTNFNNFNAKISGTGTTNQIAKFTATGAVGNSSIFDNGNVGINQPNPTEKLDVVGNGKFSGTVTATSFARNGGLSTDAQMANGTVKAMGNVDNTSDANKPISTATQTALDLKPNTTSLGSNAFNSINYLPISNTFGILKDCNAYSSSNIEIGFNWVNSPVNDIAALTTIFYSEDWISQTFTLISDRLLTYTRNRYSGTTWSEWSIQINSNNHQNYSLPLTGGTITGTVTASPATLPTQLATLGQVNAVASSGTYTPNITNDNNSGTFTGISASYTKIGNIVNATVSFGCSSTTSNTLTIIDITLPFASDGASIGMGNLSLSDEGGILGFGRILRNGRIEFKSVSTLDHLVVVNFQYVASDILN